MRERELRRCSRGPGIIAVGDRVAPVGFAERAQDRGMDARVVIAAEALARGDGRGSRIHSPSLMDAEDGGITTSDPRSGYHMS